MLCPQELTTAVTAAANALYCSGLTGEELEVLAAVFTQLGDTLATLAAQRALLEARCGRIAERGPER